jgi:predicted dinucleotide-binding enzyme
VSVAASGEAAKLAATTAAIGATPTSTANAVRDSEVVMLALPWTARTAAFAAAGAGAFAGKLVIDATNPYLDSPQVEDLGGRASSEVVASELPGARVVKAFNTLWWDKLAHGARPQGAPDRIALPVSGDDAAAKATVMALLDGIGFDAANAGPLSASRRQEPDQPLYARTDSLAQLRQALG